MILIMKLLVLSGLALLFACNGIPRDPDDTLGRIRDDRSFRVGLVAGTTADQAAARAIVTALGNETGATPRVVAGTTEPLLLALEAGSLDLVVGARFDERSPWATRVTLGSPLRRYEVDGSATATYAVARNGENAWITLVQRVAERVGPTS